MTDRLNIFENESLIHISFLKDKEKKIEYEIYGDGNFFYYGFIESTSNIFYITFEKPEDKIMFIKITEISLKNKNIFVRFYKNIEKTILKNVLMKITKTSQEEQESDDLNSDNDSDISSDD